MAVTATPVFEQTVKTGEAVILNADTTTAKDLYTAGTNGAAVHSITVYSSDTANRDIALTITRSGGSSRMLTTVQIPLSSGDTNAIPPVDLMRHSQMPALATDAQGNRVLYLAAGDKLSINATATITTAKTIIAVAQAGDF